MDVRLGRSPAVLGRNRSLDTWRASRCSLANEDRNRCRDSTLRSRRFRLANFVEATFYSDQTIPCWPQHSLSILAESGTKSHYPECRFFRKRANRLLRSVCQVNWAPRRIHPLADRSSLAG